MFALVEDVLGQFGKEVKGPEDLEVAGDTGEQVVAGRRPSGSGHSAGR